MVIAIKNEVRVIGIDRGIGVFFTVEQFRNTKRNCSETTRLALIRFEVRKPDGKA
jgi:hypothetical protein